MTSEVIGKKGKEYIYELLYPGGGEDGKPFLMGLTSIEELKKKIAEVKKKIEAQEKDDQQRKKGGDDGQN